MGEVKDYVKNVESKDKLQFAVDRNKINDGFDFNKFDQEMEEHFNNFLESHKQEFTENTSRETIQAAFNDWLDNELIKVDDFKDNLIEVAIIGPTSFELQKFQTVSELGILQEKIIAEKEKTQKTEVVSVNGRDLHIDTYKDASGEKVDVNKIAGLFNENFERKGELLNLLKQGGIDNVKKFQRIIADLAEDGSEDAKGKSTLLGRFGVDGKFGGNTMKAFEDYISNNKKTTDNGTSAESGDSTETGASTGTGTSAETGSSTKIEASTESGTSAETGTSTESGDNETGQARADMTATRTQAAITGNPALNPEIAKRSVPQNAEGELNVETQELSLAPGELETKLNEELKKIADNLPEIRVLSDGTKYNLYIPKGLGDFRAFNVAYTPEMSQYIKVLPNTEGVECFVVPSNIKIGLKKDVITNTLVLGDYEIGNGFISLNSNSQVVGDPQKYSGDLNQASLKITELSLDKNNGKPQVLAEQQNAEMVEAQRAKPKFERALGELSHGKKEVDDVMKLFTSGGTVTYKNENMPAKTFLGKVKSKEIKIDELSNLALNITLDPKSTDENLLIQSVKFSDSKADGKENTEQKGSTADVQIYYDVDVLISDMKKGREARSEKDALEMILGLRIFADIDNLSTNIEGYEKKGQERKDLKGIEKALKLFSNGHETNITIIDFFNLAAEQYATGKEFNISELGKEPTCEGTAKKFKVFGELYKKYRKEEGGPLFKRTMGIMEDYFVRGNVDEKSIIDLYNSMNVGTREGYIDPDKEKEVFRGLFDGKNVGIDLGVPYQSSEQLKSLRKIVKKIDINELFQSGKLEGKGNNLDKREKQFYDLYKLYKKGELEGDQYYQKVFEFIVSTGRGNTTLVDAINTINLIQIIDKVEFETGKENEDSHKKEKSKDEMHYNSEEEKRFILLLSDFNHDARIDTNDSGLKMGQQIRNLYKSVNIDFNNAGLDDQIETGGQVRKNVVDYAKQYFNNASNSDIAEKLNGIESVADLNQKMKEDPTILIALQNMLKNSSISINSIFRYGDRASEMFMKELMQDEKIDAQYNKIFEGLVTQGVNPTAKQALKPIILGSLMDNSVGMGLGAAYDAGNVSFSAVLGVADVPGVGPTAGLVVGCGGSIPAGENWTIDLGGSAGASYNAGFIPMFSVYAGASRVASNGLMRDDFDATTLTKIHGGANFTMIGAIPSGGLSAGVSMDKLGGIDKQESMLRPQITSVISEFLNDAEITGIVFGNNEINDEQKEKCINNIREKLGAKYGKMDEDLLDKAANNLYMGFVYYAAETSFANASEQEKKAIISKITNNIVNNYVTQRRNDKIEELNGKATVSDVTVGVQFLAGYWPIPMMGVTFTKYSNLYSRETPESIAEYESNLSKGQSMGYLEHSVDANGDITLEAITYLNEKMSIASKYDLKKMQIRFDSLDENDKSKNIIFIPRELCKFINISVDPNLKDFIKSDEEGFKIPLNAQLSLLTYTRTDATKFNLIIGDYKKENGDIDLNIKSEFDGNPLAYEYKEGKYVTTKHKINADMETLYNKDSFPLSKCIEIKENKIYFETKEDISCVGQNIEIKDGKLIVPANADLTITREIDGTYTAICSTASNETHVTYIDKKTINESKKEESLENLFEGYNELNAIFTDIEKKLSSMDNSEITNGRYAAFMNAAATEDIQDTLDDSDYEAAFSALTDLLNGKLKDPCFDGLRGKLANATEEEKVMIVDRFKGIFSYNYYLTNGKSLDNQINGIGKGKGRGNKYKELYGYDWETPFPLTSDFDYRQAIQEKLNNKGTFKREPNPNLIGMTAFYRLGDKSAGRSYMMTELGGTNVLGGETIPITESNDLAQTKEWFLNNLKKSGVHKELLKASLSAKLKSILNVEELTLSDENLISILQGEDIDIGHKKVKINVKYVFYLLGECANESIGIDLGSDGGNNIIINDNEITDVTIKPELTYEGVSGVYAGTAEAVSRYEIGNSNSATLGFAVGKGKATENEQVIDKDHTEPGENIDPNSNHTEPGENVDPTNNEGGEINLGGNSNGEPTNNTQSGQGQNNGGLMGHGPGNNNETGSLFGGEPRLDPSGGGIILGGEGPTMTPGTYEFTDNLGTHVVTISETENSYIVHTVTTPLPQHGHALTASQSETHSETKVVKKEK